MNDKNILFFIIFVLFLLAIFNYLNSGHENMKIIDGVGILDDIDRENCVDPKPLKCKNYDRNLLKNYQEKLYSDRRNLHNLLYNCQ
jgi:hypothetical protein